MPENKSSIPTPIHQSPILKSHRRGPSSVSLVVAALLLALVAVMAIPVINVLMGNATTLNYPTTSTLPVPDLEDDS